MFSTSYFNLLNLDVDYPCWNRPRLPKLMTVPGIIPENSDSDDTVTSLPQRWVIVSNQLPIRAYRDKEINKWVFDWDRDSLYLQLKDGFFGNVEVYFVGCLKVEVDANEQDEVGQVLLENFNCVATFLSADLIEAYYHGFCKHYLWPLFHYTLPITRSHGDRFNKDFWQAYVHVNRVFADKVMEVVNLDDDFVWIHDYHLMIMSTVLRKRNHRSKIGFFLHSPFPSSEIYRTIPVREELLRALLNCDVVGFHTFDYARHFLSCCSRMLGLEYQSKRGHLGLEYYGRSVCIKICPVGIHMGQIESVMSLDYTANKVKELKDKYEGKTVMLGVDDLDMFKGISLKFQALRQLLIQKSSFLGKVVLVQIKNPARSRGNDIQNVRHEIESVANEINEEFGNADYKPIVCINGPVSTEDKVAYYAVSECVVVNAVRDGMNLVPYKYTVSRQGSVAMDKVLGQDGLDVPRKSVIIVSEFIGCSPSLSGAIRVNPWNIESVADGMFLALTMSDGEKLMRHEKHYKYVASHDVSYWARSFIQDLERCCKDLYNKRCWPLGFGLNYRAVSLDPNFRKLSVDQIASAYETTSRRLILLDYDGTVMPQMNVDKRPSEEVVSIINDFCSDPKNVVFIVSGRGKDSLSKWFSPCEKLGLSAEHGGFTRWSKDKPWESCGSRLDLEWKQLVLPIMKQYTESTDGSYIEEKETALVWHYQHADPNFGTWQAKELLDQLESVLVKESVVVKSGQLIVEVNPQGISKGVVVEKLISTLRSQGVDLDFVLCIGDDRSDEDMFERISEFVSKRALPEKASVFACTVGHKPSNARYYLNDTTEVIEMLDCVVNPHKIPYYKASAADDVLANVTHTYCSVKVESFEGQ